MSELKMDEICINNDEICIKNDEISFKTASNGCSWMGGVCRGVEHSAGAGASPIEKDDDFLLENVDLMLRNDDFRLNKWLALQAMML